MEIGVCSRDERGAIHQHTGFALLFEALGSGGHVVELAGGLDNMALSALLFCDHWLWPHQLHLMQTLVSLYYPLLEILLCSDLSTQRSVPSSFGAVGISSTNPVSQPNIYSTRIKTCDHVDHNRMLR